MCSDEESRNTQAGLILYITRAGRGWAILELALGFLNHSQTRLIKFNPVPLGAGRVPEKIRPIAIPKAGCCIHIPLILLFDSIF